MHCGAVEEEDDIISSSSGSSSTSPTDHQRAKEQSLHSPLSLTASTTTSSLSTDSSHHSPASPCSFLIRELEAPSGLNLLVAALDAQDPCAFRRQQQQEHQEPYQTQFEASLIGDEDSFSHHPTSDEEAGSEKRNCRRKSTVPDTSKDETYWEKRRRNNEAAKRSREKRRINDMAMEARLMELSRENSLLKHELVAVKKRQLTTPTPSPSHLLVPTVPDTPPIVSSTPEIATQIGALSPHQSSLATSVAAAAHLASFGAPRSPFLPNAAGLAAAGFVNPLLAMVPPAMLLQAAIAQQQQQRPIASPPVSAVANMKRFGSFSATDSSILHAAQHPSVPLLGSEQRQQTPSTPSMLTAALSAPTSPGAPTASSFSDGKQYLRYKLLERQLQQQSIGGFAPPSSHSLGLLGSAISGPGNGPKPANQRSNSISCQPPPAKRQRTAPSAASAKTAIADSIRADTDTSLSLKECLSSLAVSLISPGALPTPSGEKGASVCDPSLSADRKSARSSPITNEDHRQQNGNQESSGHRQLQSIMFDDSISRIGDLLRARTHSDSSQSSAGISSHGSSTSTSVSIVGTGALSPGTMMELEFRNSISDRRRDSNNSDSGIISDVADRRLSVGSCGKRQRSDHERYMERRRRNNEAAKRCRANRRAMFEYRYQRAQELENENARLKDEMRQLSRELTELKELLAKRGDDLRGEYVLQAVNKDREAPETARLKNLINDTNELDEENRSSKLSIVDEIKEEEQVSDEAEETVARDGRPDETPLDFTVKKEKV